MSGDAKPLEGKVARILSEREIAINIGRRDGVTPGMQFAVLASSMLDIVDPDTGEVLDRIERTKVVVEAIELRDRITICSIPHRAPTSLSSFVRILALDPDSPQVEDADLPPPLDPNESYVKVGDRVRRIEEPAPRRPMQSARAG